MQLSEAVLGRRSIRKFKDQPVPEEDILEIIRLASHAPSAGNQQMWHFTVVGGDIKARLATVINEAFKEIASEAGAEENWLEGPTRAAKKRPPRRMKMPSFRFPILSPDYWLLTPDRIRSSV